MRESETPHTQEAQRLKWKMRYVGHFAIRVSGASERRKVILRMIRKAAVQ